MEVLPWKNLQSEQKENCQVKFRTVSSLEVDQLSGSERSFSSLYENKHNTWKLLLALLTRNDQTVSGTNGFKHGISALSDSSCHH